MKFRTRIWMMPASAAALFTAGVAVCVVLGTQLSSTIEWLRHVDEPFLAQVLRVDRATELVQSTVQAASIEGDAGKLDDLEPTMKDADEALAAIAALQGKAGAAAALRGAFHDYERAAVAAAKGMIAKSGADVPDQVRAMQQSLERLHATLAARKAEARSAIDARYDDATRGAAHTVLVVIATGLVVLAVLGVSSRLLVTSVWRELGEEPERLRDLVARIAGGDIESRHLAEGSSPRSINGALFDMTGGLRTMITDIRQVADSIRIASSEIAAGNLDLSQRTEETASNLQQAASAMEELSATVRNTAGSASTANALASAAAQAARRGGEVVAEVVSNMEQIDGASRKITDIIAVIDGIAFQTNILALNAAVEAARAGEQGRGFAVVAAEVRTLAQRSAAAARQIKELIAASTERIESGTRLVRDAGSTMVDVVRSVTHVGSIIDEIATAALQQSAGVGALSDTVTSIDQMTQQNSALVEQSAAAAQNLSQQTAMLVGSVSRFRLEGGADA